MEKNGNNHIKHLSERMETFRQKLLKLLDEWYYLYNILHPQIIFDYERHFGDIEIELRKKNRLATELHRKSEIYEQKKKQGEEITEYTVKIVNVIVKKELERKEKNRIRKENSYYKNPHRYSSSNYTNYQKNPYTPGNGFTYKQYNTASSYVFNSNNKFTNAQSEINYFYNVGVNRFAKRHQNINEHKDTFHPFDFMNESDEETLIPHLYRNIVKRIHPDISGENSVFQKYWHNVQDAYQRRNLQRLKLFNITLCNIDENHNYSDDDKTRMLLSKIQLLENGINDETQKINDIKNEEPFILTDKLKDKLWVARKKRNLRNKLFNVNRTIELKKHQLNCLTARNWDKQAINKSIY